MAVKGKSKAETATRKAVGEVWKELLGCNALKDESDFFDLGGDSILALNMLFELGGRFEVELPPGLLFEHPQFSNFCGAVHNLRAGRKSQ